MKKLAIFVVAAVAIAGTLWTAQRLFLKHGSGIDPAMLAPEQTILFLELPDLEKTAARWPETSLAKIGAEPEFAAFFEKPLELLRERISKHAQTGAWKNLRVTSAFVALVNIEGDTPVVLAGFRFKGGRDALDRAMEAPKSEFEVAFPSLTVEAFPYRHHEIETATTPRYSLASVVLEDLFLIATDSDVLTEALDRLDAIEEAAPALDRSGLFAGCLDQMPRRHDTFLFLRVGPAVDRILLLSRLAGSPLSPDQEAALRGIDAVAASTTIEGSDFRDRIFLKTNNGATPLEPISRSGLRLTSGDTLLHFATVLAMPEAFGRADPSSAGLPGLAGASAGLTAALESLGVDNAQLASAVGGEFSLSLDWSSVSVRPSILVALEAADATAASELMKAVAGARGASLEEGDQGAVTVNFAPVGLMRFSPTLALVDDTFLFALDGETVFAGIAGLRAGEEPLAATKLFETAMRGVAEPNLGIGFVDTAAFFERLYSSLRPALMFGGPLIPGAEGNVDFTKLPSSASVTRHLGPIAFSAHRSEEGILYESTGPVTLNQLVILISGAVAAVGIQQAAGE